MNLKLRLAIGCLLAGTTTFAQGANLLEVYQRALQSDPLLREADATRFTMTIESVPSENPRTGKLVAPSVIAALRGLVSELKVGS